MPELSDVLGQGKPVRLCKGTVLRIVNGYADIGYGGGEIKYASKMDGATYAANDVVIFLLDDESGALIIGKQTIGTPPAVNPPPASPLTVNAASYGTYDSETDSWTASVLNQSPTTWGAWFYAAGAFSSLATMTMARTEIEVIRTGGGPPEFVGHVNTTGSGTLILSGEPFASVQPAVGVLTWIALPNEWGEQLVSGTIKGIAVGGGLFAGTYSGTGRLRLTVV